MDPETIDISPGVVSGAKVATGSALAVHTDSFDTPEEKVRAYTYRAHKAEAGEDLDDPHHYTPFDYIESFEAVKRALKEWGHNPIGSAHAVSRGGKRYGAFIAFMPQKPNAFGSMNFFEQYLPMVFVRNSYDKSYPFTIHAAAHLYEAEVLWVAKADVGRRRHTRKFDADVYDVVTKMLDRLDDLLVEMEHRFEAYNREYVPDLARMHDLIFRAHEAGVIPKTSMPDAKDAFVEALGTGGPWRLFPAMQYVLAPRRGKDIFRYRRLCGDYEAMLDKQVGFTREVRLQD